MVDRNPDRYVEGQACICTEPGLPALRSELWHDAKCDRWRALGGKNFDKTATANPAFASALNNPKGFQR